jgi:hypothetical protein
MVQCNVITMHCRSSLITSVPPNPQHAPAAPPTNPAAILPNEQCTNRLSVEPRYYTFPHRVTSHIDRATSKLKVNRQVHTGSLILARIYWRRGVGLIAPSTDIPFKVGPSDVDHLVAGEVPAYAAICTLALPPRGSFYLFAFFFVLLPVLLRSRVRNTGSCRRSLNLIRLLYYHHLRSLRITLSPLS